LSGPDRKGGAVYARIATFAIDPARIGSAIADMRSEVQPGNVPPGLDGAKMMTLIDREAGKGVGVTLFDTEEAMRRGDAALNAMNPGSGERRTAVEFFEVPVRILG
jgi:hypothetical protein